MKYGLAIVSFAAVVASLVILFRVSLGGIVPLAILSAVFVGLLVARKVASTRVRG